MPASHWLVTRPHTWPVSFACHHHTHPSPNRRFNSSQHLATLQSYLFILFNSCQSTRLSTGLCLLSSLAPFPLHPQPLHLIAHSLLILLQVYILFEWHFKVDWFHLTCWLSEAIRSSTKPIESKFQLNASDFVSNYHCCLIITIECNLFIIIHRHAVLVGWSPATGTQTSAKSLLIFFIIPLSTCYSYITKLI